MTDETATPEVTQEAPKDDLDGLLAEWDEQPEPPAEQHETPEGDDVAARLDAISQRLQEHDAEKAYQRDEKDFNAAIEKTVSDLDGLGFKPSAEMVKAYFWKEYAESDHAKEVWNSRDFAPDVFESMRKRIRDDIKAEFQAYENRPDPDLTADREAVRLAVKGANTGRAVEEEDVPDFRGKSDQEYESWIRDQARKHG